VVWRQLHRPQIVYIVQQLECAGHAVHTIIIDDLDTLVAELANVEPVKEGTYPTGPRKTIYLDPDGNEIGFGEVPSGLLGCGAASFPRPLAG
jgi:hypothetical protein